MSQDFALAPSVCLSAFIFTCVLVCEFNLWLWAGTETHSETVKSMLEPTEQPSGAASGSPCQPAQ